MDLRCAARSPLVLVDHGAGAAVPA